LRESGGGEQAGNQGGEELGHFGIFQSYLF